MENNILVEFSESQKLKQEFQRYLSFWPYFLISLFIFAFLGYIYLRYADYKYTSSAIIEIVDEAQNTEMSLPSAMTIFNRSMINLENETSILSSFSLHKKVVTDLNSNIRFYSVGKIKTSENHKEEWLDNYNLEFKINTNEFKNIRKYVFNFEKNLVIDVYSDSDIVNSYKFKGLTTKEVKHNLPFDFEITGENNYDEDKFIVISPINDLIDSWKNEINVSPFGEDSDQLVVSVNHTNKRIAREYIDYLILAFDRDGIIDRQLEYKNTIDFVEKRSQILGKELELIEQRKQEFKEINNLSDLQSDATFTIQGKYNYNAELFEAESQKSLAEFLLSSISSKNSYEYLPVNIGLEKSDLNSLVSQYNQILTEKDRYMLEAGQKNNIVIIAEKKLDNYLSNISSSIQNYINALDIKIDDLETKESEFLSDYKNVPENEKILRTIERELTVKESLFLLLLQKKEEAAINFAVVKPTIKIIDYSITTPNPISPNKMQVWIICILLGIFVPFSVFYLKFTLDTKIHIKDHLIRAINDQIPVLAEIPQVDNYSFDFEKNKRSPILESIRMLVSNFNFILNEDKRCSVFLVTSTVKGEGKTLISVNTASILSSNKKKVIILGADLRNPQIHKMVGLDKSLTGISDLIYKNDHDNYNDYIIKDNNFDILLSGTIPPNPTELLARDSFEKLINILRSQYDYIIIDSAPTLLVSDTFEISKFVDFTIYVIRANYTEVKLCDYILEAKNQNKLKNVNLVLNGVGRSEAYGYKYGYQYGYKYGYKYSYNYGYGYGYDQDE